MPGVFRSALYGALATLPDSTARNTLAPSAPTTVPLTVVPASALTPAVDFRYAADTAPRLRLTPGGVMFGPGGAVSPPVTLSYSDSASLGKGAQLIAPPSHSAEVSGDAVKGLQLLSTTAADFDGSNGGTSTRFYTRSKASGGTNGTRGDSITTDAANTGAHSSLGCYSVFGLPYAEHGNSAFDDKGSLHHFFSLLKVDPYSGGGDVYCEALNFYGSLETNRKGAFTANMEVYQQINSGKPARACGIRTITAENNDISAYSAANFGAGSRWIASGSIGVEVGSAGPQATGTGLFFWGGGGFVNYIRALLNDGSYAFGVSGGGHLHAPKGIEIPVKAGVPTDADFTVDTNGNLCVDTTNHHLYFRSGGTWRRLVPA